MLCRVSGAFRRGDLIIPFGDKRLDTDPTDVTSHGLRITLPLYHKKNNNTVYGLLNCHWANTMDKCIGIPLRPTPNPQVYERSAQRNLDSVRLEIIAETGKRTIYISLKPQSELPFAAAVALRVSDKEIRDEWHFSQLKVLEPANASYHWHSEYSIFRLSWLLKREIGRTDKERIRLSWPHESLGEDGLTLEIDCIIGFRLDAFEVHAMSFASTQHEFGVRPRTVSDRAGGLVAEAFCDRIFKHAGPMFVRATLISEDVFGEKTYVLTLEVLPDM